VHDAHADYYETSTWLSREEKRRIDKKTARKQASRLPSNRKYKITVDLAGRRVFTQEHMNDPGEGEDSDSDSDSDSADGTARGEGEGEGEGQGDEEEEEQGGATVEDLALHLRTAPLLPPSAAWAASSSASGANEALAANPHTAGEVYRLLRQSLAPWRPQ